MSYLTLLAIFTSIIAITSGAPNQYPFLIQVRGSAAEVEQLLMEWSKL